MGRIFKQTKSENWSIDYVDATGKRIRESTKQPVQRVAERMLARKEEEAAAIRGGLIDPHIAAAKKEAERPIFEHVNAYASYQRSKGVQARHIHEGRQRLEGFIEFGRVAALAGITVPVVSAYINSRRDKPGSRVGSSVSDRTLQSHTMTIRAFVRWAVVHGLLPRDPLGTLPMPSGKRETKRRFLLPEEWPYLRKATEVGPVRSRIPGPERALVYWAAIRTGYRVNELKQLRPGSLRQVGSEFALCLDGKHTKNGDDAIQYIGDDLNATLREHLAANPDRRSLFAGHSWRHIALELRLDLAAARAAWLGESSNPEERKKRERSDFLLPINAAEEVLDFHSLRHTCGAWLMIAGVPIQVVQRVMRHSSITLTVDTYGHLAIGQEADAGRKLENALKSGLLRHA